MVKGNAVLVVLVLVVDAGSPGKSLLHRRLGPRGDTTREVGIAADGREVRRARREIMVRKGPERRGACPSMVVVAEGLRVRLEGRGVGGGAVRAREVAGVPTAGLPVDGLHAVLEVGRRAKLPLADDGPEDGRSSDADSDDDEDDDSSMGETRCRFWCAGLSGRGCGAGSDKENRRRLPFLLLLLS